METIGEPVVATRQPLFDAQRRVLGYQVRSETALNSAGLALLAGRRRVFVPISTDALVERRVEGLTAGQVVLQVAGDIDPTPEVRDACADLRRAGFQIALDHFAPDEAGSPLIRYADFVTAEASVARAVMHRPVRTLRPGHQPSVVAVGVDTVDQFDETVALGCAAFQGDFIARPRLTATSNIPARHITQLRLLRALQNSELSMVELEELVKPDAALVLRVMRAVNSAAYAQQTKISSVRQALMLVGTSTIREWVMAWTMDEFSHSAPSELVLMATIRGRFCELMSKGSYASTGGDGFLLGLCSLLDAILHSPMEAVLKHLPLCESNAAALLGEHNGQRALLDSAIAWERGAWEQSRRLAAGAGLDPVLLPAAYNGAIAWMARFQEVAGHRLI